jgi:hypothetical protein
MGLVTIFYCLRFETSLFVASYDPQGYGGGIRPRLHTEGTEFLFPYTLISSRHEPRTENTAFIVAYSLPRDVLTESLPSNRSMTKNLSSQEYVYRAVAWQCVRIWRGSEVRRTRWLSERSAHANPFLCKSAIKEVRYFLLDTWSRSVFLQQRVIRILCFQKVLSNSSNMPRYTTPLIVPSAKKDDTMHETRLTLDCLSCIQLLQEDCCSPKFSGYVD